MVLAHRRFQRTCLFKMRRVVMVNVHLSGNSIIFCVFPDPPDAIEAALVSGGHRFGIRFLEGTVRKPLFGSHRSKGTVRKPPLERHRSKGTVWKAFFGRCFSTCCSPQLTDHLGGTRQVPLQQTDWIWNWNWNLDFQNDSSSLCYDS